MGEQPHTSGTRGGQSAVHGSAVLTPPTGLPAVPPQRIANSTPPPVQAPTVVEPCACGHAREAHEHYRRGSDCGACGAETCGRFRRQGGPVRKMLRRVGLAA